MTKMVDMTGKTFGSLTVLSYAGSRYGGSASRAAWLCRCAACGNTTSRPGRN